MKAQALTKRDCDTHGTIKSVAVGMPGESPKHISTGKNEANAENQGGKCGIPPTSSRTK